MNTEGEQINTASIGLVFPDLLDVVDFNKGDSIFSLWPQDPETTDGIISFVGGTPQGFIGDGTVLKVTFRGKETGRAEVNFEQGSKVLLNDGKGTEAKTVFLEGGYEIIEKPEKLLEISSKTHPNQNKWYSHSSFFVHWDLVQENLYSYLLIQDPLAIPDETSDRPEGELLWLGDMEYPKLEDGIYYFHLREAIRDENQELVWGPKATYRMMIDTQPPEEFTPKIAQQETVFEGKYFLSFSTIDKMSGVDHYEILETRDKQQATEEWKVAVSPYLLEDQSLNNIIKVKALDKAGNERIAEIIPSEKPSPFPYWAIIVGLAIVIVVYWIWKKTRRTTNYENTKNHEK